MKTHKTSYIIKIYLKGNKKPLCEVESDNKEPFDNLYNNLSSATMFYIKFGQIIFKKADFDYATIEEK